MRNNKEIQQVPEKNIRHIVFGVFFFGVLLFLLGIFIWETQLKKIQPITPQTLGVSSSERGIEIPDKKDAEKIINNIQKEMSAITPENVTSSDSAILRIIGDLQKLRNGESSAVETVCKLVCNR